MGELNASPTNKPMKILALQHKASAVFQYRMNRPLSQFDTTFRKKILNKNDKCTVGDLAKRFKRYGDIWVIKYIDQFYTLDVLHSMKKAVDAKIVVDVDDNIWQIPIGNVAHGDFKTFSNRAMMMAESVKAADWITVSTEPLKQILLPLNQNIEVLPNYIDPKEWKFKRKKHDKVRIGWVWSPTHIPDNIEVREALKEINERYKDKAEIVIFGTDKNIFDFDTVNIPAVKYDKFPKVFTEAGIDISIAPLADNEFNKCKSNIKWLESAMAGAVFIGSKVYPYEFSVKQGKTGYVCNGKNQWIKHISWLIKNESKRKELVESARKEVLEKYSDGKKWLTFYNSL